MPPLPRLLPWPLAAALLLAAGGCGAMPPAGRPAGDRSHTETSRWEGRTSLGDRLVVDQRRTGANTYAFTGRMTRRDGGRVDLAGSGVFDPARLTNIYRFSQPRPTRVTVRTEDLDDGRGFRDTVLESADPLFPKGSSATYRRL